MTEPRIHRLPRDVVNKIAAGEVVERPASVVKELVENAIDAESSRIEVTLEDGGKRLIRVVDDGVGMSPADLALAFESHATSKLSDPDDLFRIDTLGFRGEALASIASVSRCRAISRERGAAEAASVECIAGRLADVRASGAPQGTIVEVRDLFFNTPARMKFLRTTGTELRHAVEAFTRLALPHPALAMTLLHGKKPALRLPRCNSPRERVAAIFGDDLCARLLPVRSESSAMVVTGLVTPPGEGRTSSMQYVFLNGRYIRDRAIQRAIADAYRSRIMRGRFPGAFLFLQIDPARVDVNVHPTKVEVRFRDAAAVFTQVLAGVEKALRAAGPATADAPVAEPSGLPRAESRGRTGHREGVRKAITEFFERDARGPAAPAVAVPLHRQAARRPDQPEVVPAQTTEAAGTTASPVEADAERPASGVAAPPMRAHGSFQIHDTYIVEEVDGGFALIDQHALHERILYEDLRRRVKRASVPRQRLLVPEPVDLGPNDFMRVMEMKESLLRMGVEVEAFGERTIAVHAVPHVAGEVNPRELLLDILSEARERLPDRPGESEDLLLRVIACKAAVKAGQRLTRAQLEALLEQRDRLGPEPTCPHGRPTTLRFDLHDIEKQFRRR